MHVKPIKGSILTMIMNCDKCGKVFEKSENAIKKSKHHYCSTECSGKGKTWNRLNSEPEELDFSKPNIDLSAKHDVSYTTIANYRKKYASHTLRPMREHQTWKNKVLQLKNGKISYSIVGNFIEQSAFRVAADNLGVSVRCKVLDGQRYKMFIKAD